MAIAVLSGILGNLNALNAVLKDAERRDVSDVHCLGGLVGLCGNPVKVLDEATRFAGVGTGLYEEAIKLAVTDEIISQGGLEERFRFTPAQAQAIMITAQQIKKDANADPLIEFFYTRPGQLGIGEYAVGINTPFEKAQEKPFPEGVSVIFAPSNQPGIYIRNTDTDRTRKADTKRPIKLKKTETALVGVDNVGLSHQDDNFLRDLERRGGLSRKIKNPLLANYVVFDSENRIIEFAEQEYNRKPAESATRKISMPNPFPALRGEEIKIAKKKTKKRQPQERIAVLSDIHGNYEALDLVLADAKAMGVTKVFCLGDDVGYGAQTVAVLERTGTFDGNLLGNHEDGFKLAWAKMSSKQLRTMLGMSRRAARSLVIAAKQVRNENNGKELADRLAERPDQVDIRPDAVGIHAQRDSSGIKMLYPLTERLFKAHGFEKDSYDGNFQHPRKLIEDPRFSKYKFIFTGHIHIAGGFIVNEGGEAREYNGEPDENHTLTVEDNERGAFGVGSVGQSRSQDPATIDRMKRMSLVSKKPSLSADWTLLQGNTMTFRKVVYYYEGPQKAAANAGMEDPFKIIGRRKR